MDQTFRDQFDALLEKYTELLLGESNDELIEKIKMWALYTYIAKSMPDLANYWNALYPNGKEEMKKLIFEIKHMNDLHREAKK